MGERFDAIVIGGGFYGLRIAIHLRERLRLSSVLVLESGDRPMARASFANQARVHNGYHYPRSVLTGLRSRLNLPRFRSEFDEAVVDRFQHHYAIATRLSKTNARQFEVFCRRIGAGLAPASEPVRRAFDPARIERVFRVDEPAFDTRVLLAILLARMQAVGGIELRTGVRAEHVAGRPDDLEVSAGDRSFHAPKVVSAVYSGINALHEASGFPLVGLQHELTELALVTVPPVMAEGAITVMDGPFFSIMPFPARGAHTLSHVRFTPHRRWKDGEESALAADGALDAAGMRSQYGAMRADVVRYLPAAAEMRHRESLYEVKSVLTRSISDDSRPILHRRDHGIRGYSCVLGGKLDNVYDVLEELDHHAA